MAMKSFNPANDKFHGAEAYVTVGSGVRLHLPGSLGEHDLTGQRDFRYLGDTVTPASPKVDIATRHLLRVLHHQPLTLPEPLSGPENFLVLASLLTAAYAAMTHGCVKRPENKTQ